MRTRRKHGARRALQSNAPYVRLLEAEAIVVGLAYLMAAVPVGGIVLAGRMSPLYRLPTSDLCRWWSRCAILVAVWLVAWTVTS